MTRVRIATDRQGNPMLPKFLAAGNAIRPGDELEFPDELVEGPISRGELEVVHPPRKPGRRRKGGEGGESPEFLS